MFTLLLNNETRKVIGLISPCHRPCQNPAMCTALTGATLFGPAAHEARSSTPAASSPTSAIRDFDIERPLPPRANTVSGAVVKTPCPGSKLGPRAVDVRRHATSRGARRQDLGVAAGSRTRRCRARAG